MRGPRISCHSIKRGEDSPNVANHATSNSITYAAFRANRLIKLKFLVLRQLDVCIDLQVPGASPHRHDGPTPCSLRIAASVASAPAHHAECISIALPSRLRRSEASAIVVAPMAQQK